MQEKIEEYTAKINKEVYKMRDEGKSEKWIMLRLLDAQKFLCKLKGDRLNLARLNLAQEYIKADKMQAAEKVIDQINGTTKQVIDVWKKETQKDASALKKKFSDFKI